MNEEIIVCSTCKQEKSYYYDEDCFCVYESKCQCDKNRLNKKKFDEAIRLIELAILNGDYSYAK